MDAQTPSYLLPYIPPKEFVKTQKSVLALNKISGAESNEINNASIEYQNKLKSIRAKFDSQRSKLKMDNKILKVLTVPSTSLPLSIQLVIENYTPQDTKHAPSKRAFARELLTDYKIFLLQKLKSNPKIDLDKFIEDNMTK